MKRWLVAISLVTLGCGGTATQAAPSTASSSGDEAVSPSSPASTPPAEDLASAEIPSPCGDGTRVRLSHGAAEVPSTIGLEEPGEIELEPIGDADLDGDGRIERLALVRCMPGGSGTFDAVRAYHVEDARLVEVAAIEGGDRADGGLEGGRIVGADVIVGRYSGAEEGVCCPTHVTEETWRLVRGTFVQTHVGEPHEVAR